MGKFFSDAVEQALQYIYYDNRLGVRRGREGFELLERASEAGDGDADCVLARCLCGDQYVWSGHHFPEDDQRVMKLLHRSIQRGSALGVLVGKRSGALTPVWQSKCPITLQEAFKQVLDKAAGGDAFCQYTIGNVYFWWDFLTIDGKSREDFADDAAAHAYIAENVVKCEDWFWRAFRGGMYLAGNNLYNYYQKGDGDYVAPRPEKAAGIFREGAELGYPLHQLFYAQELEEAGDEAGAAQWKLKAAEGGQPGLWYKLGQAYEKGKGVEKDPEKSFHCFSHALEEGEQLAYSALGLAYFFGKGVEADPPRAFAYFQKDLETGEDDFSCPYLAQCYLEGWGTAQDYRQAYQMAWQTRDKERSCYVLGRIYCEGLGMPQDIAMGVDFLDRAPNIPQAREERRHYKKSLLGRWTRV